MGLHCVHDLESPNFAAVVGWKGRRRLQTFLLPKRKGSQRGVFFGASLDDFFVASEKKREPVHPIFSSHFVFESAFDEEVMWDRGGRKG